MKTEELKQISEQLIDTFYQAGRESIEVNSLHTQGVDKLADSLEIEGIAKDETVEAISLKDYKGYFYGVQWHPETSSTSDDFSKKLFDLIRGTREKLPVPFKHFHP